MNSRFLVRGKRKDNDEWIKGDSIKFPKTINYIGTCWINGMGDNTENNWVEVDPKTVGWCVGLSDKNEKLIFEGDVVTVPKEDEFCKIIWDEGTARFAISGFNVICDFDNYWGYELEVVGNIYDNPEFVKYNKSEPVLKSTTSTPFQPVLKSDDEDFVNFELREG